MIILLLLAMLSPSRIASRAFSTTSASTELVTTFFTMSIAVSRGTPLLSSVFLGKSFVICVLGGLGSVPGALVGGITLGLLESFGAVVFG